MIIISELLHRAYAIYRDEGARALLSSTGRYLAQTSYPYLPEYAKGVLETHRLKSKHELRQFWQDIDTEQHVKHLKLDARSRFLVDLMRPYLDPSDRILEIGCNVGRNLHYLHEAGYENLVGIEINDEALELLAEHYPKLHEDAEFHHASVEDVITEFPTNSIGVTFTFAVLAHLHPAQEFVFEEMVRITDRYIVTIENEGKLSETQIPRNYGDVFSELGCTQIEVMDGSQIVRRTERTTEEYRARVFRVDDATEDGRANGNR